MDREAAEAAREAWGEELVLRRRRHQENGKRDLDHLLRILEVIGCDHGPADYADDGTVAVLLCPYQPAETTPSGKREPEQPQVWATARQGELRLRAGVRGHEPAVTGDAGPLDTLADVGRALVEGGTLAPGEAEEGTVELLARVLRALVDDAVDARLAGEL